MKHKLALLSIALVFSIVLILGGCSSSPASSTTPAQTTAAGQPIELKFSYWPPPADATLRILVSQDLSVTSLLCAKTTLSWASTILPHSGQFCGLPSSSRSSSAGWRSSTGLIRWLWKCRSAEMMRARRGNWNWATGIVSRCTDGSIAWTFTTSQTVPRRFASSWITSPVRSNSIRCWSSTEFNFSCSHT